MTDLLDETSLRSRLHEATGNIRPEVDLLDVVRRGARRRRAMRRMIVGASTVLVALAFGGGGLLLSDRAPGTTVPSTVVPSPPPVSSSPLPVEDASSRIALTVPLTVALSQVDGQVLSTIGPVAGSWVQLVTYPDEAVWAVVVERAKLPDGPSGCRAECAASFLVDHFRPASPVKPTLTRTTVGGLPAWRLSIDLAADQIVHVAKAPRWLTPTYLPFAAPYGAEDLRYLPTNAHTEYTLVDVPGAGLTVIYSTSDRATVDQVVSAMSFG